MNKISKRYKVSFALLIFILLGSIIGGTSLSNVQAKKKSADSKAKDDLIKKLGKAVEGKFSKIELSSFKLFDSNNTVLFYNKTKVIVPPTPPPVKCPEGEHLENGKCVPNVTPNPQGNVTVVCEVGDIQGTDVATAMREHGCNIRIGLGDLTYQDTLDNFVKLGFDRCVIGNHDSDEESKGLAIVAQALKYCGDHWVLKVGHAVFFGLNTNTKDPTAMLNWLKNLLMDTQGFMKGVTSVHFVSHKPICSTPPNSNHPIESAPQKLCGPILSSVPANVKIEFDNGHNHVSATSVSLNDLNGGSYSTIGGGGKKKYSCGTDDIWQWCDNKHNAFKAYTIANNGDYTSAFFDSSGKQIFPIP